MPISSVDHPTRIASTSPGQQSYCNLSAPQDPTSFHSSAGPKVDATHPSNLQDSFYKSSAVINDSIRSSNSPSAVQSSGDQSTYGMQSASFDQEVPDFSAMMFPSSDPFAYPNQPMTTLENYQLIKQENPMDSSMLDLPDPTTMGAPFDVYDAQTYGQMPPFFMQNQPPEFLQDTNPPTTLSSEDPNVSSPATQGYDGGQWPLNQQQRPSNLHGMGFDQLFGEDWGGWMNQYRQ